MASDAEMVSLLSAGRIDEAFEMLIDTYQNKVFRLAFAMLGERAQAEDAAQEIFIRIWRALGRYRGESALGTWIFSIARNACLTAIAKRAARRDVPLTEAPAERAAPQTSATPDVARLLESLPEAQRRAVVLFYMEERSYEDVAHMLDVPLGTVKTHLHRARKQLAIMMKESGS
jgi:RNA polymerase sigma-70 factor (ECF subfamily)